MLGIIFVALSGCSDAVTYHGDGNAASQLRPTPAFSHLLQTSAVEFRFTISDETSVRLECDENLLELIETNVTDGVLTIEPGDQVLLKPQRPCFAAVTAPSLESATQESASDMSVDGLDTPEFRALNDAGGALTLAGEVTTLHITNDGGGGIDASALEAQDAQVVNEGSGDIRLRAHGSVTITLDGSGDVHLLDAPANLTIHDDGSGAVIYPDQP